MAARRKSDDPKYDAESATRAPSDGSSSDSLDQLFGEQGALGARSDAEVAASRERLAALFGHQDADPVPATSGHSRAADDLDSIFGHSPAGAGATDGSGDSADSGFPADEAPSRPTASGDDSTRSLDALFGEAEPEGTTTAPPARQDAEVDAVFAPTEREAEYMPPAPADGDGGGGDASSVAWQETDLRPDEHAAVPPASALPPHPPTAQPIEAPVPNDQDLDDSDDEESIVLADTAEMMALFGVDDPDEDGDAEETRDDPGVGYPDDPAHTDARGENFAGAASIAPLAAAAAIAKDDPHRGDGLDDSATDDRSSSFGADDHAEVFAPRGSHAVDAPTAVLAPVTVGADPGGATGSFSPAPRRGPRGWSKRVRWSVLASVLLLAIVVVGAVVVAQYVAANNAEARALAAAVDELETAEASATEPQSVLDTAVTQYEDTVELARATADSAGPPLAAIAGMADQPLLDASNAALAALIAELGEGAVEAPPTPYERGDVDMGDIAEVRAATTVAEEHAERVLSAIRDVNVAQTDLQAALTALRAAQLALGASLPATASVIVDDNPDAEQELADAVIAAAAAVGAAQTAGGSGDTELLAYAAAVTALRADQLRAEEEFTPAPPPVDEPEPAPVPAPVPPPVQPQPQPQPTPTPTPTPTTPPESLIPPAEP